VLARAEPEDAVHRPEPEAEAALLLQTEFQSRDGPGEDIAEPVTGAQWRSAVGKAIKKPRLYFAAPAMAISIKKPLAVNFHNHGNFVTDLKKFCYVDINQRFLRRQSFT
jgi:hypothetical protein